MIGNFIIHEFAPLWLSVERVGPFQDALKDFDFTDAENEPCNLFLLASQNGRGKTTALELMTALMGMLGHQDVSSYLRTKTENSGSRNGPFSLEALDKKNGRAQWDIRVRYSENGNERTVVLSLIAGRLTKDISLRFWDDEALRRVGAVAWHRFGFCRNDAGSWDTIGSHDDWIMDLNKRIATAINSSIGGFEDSTLVWPTVIYFSAYRNIERITDQQRAIAEPRSWNYRPAHIFRTEGQAWADSLDNFLVWLKWLDDNRYERALKIVNERVFKQDIKFIKGVRKEPPEAIVVHGTNEHRLDELSSGEKSLVQLFLRLGAHMTRNTILLIDEPEAHLHDSWKYRLHTQLKKLAKEFYPGLTVILATHSPEIMKAIGFEFQEENIRKGGEIIETPEEEKEAERIIEDAMEHYDKNQEY